MNCNGLGKIILPAMQNLRYLCWIYGALGLCFHARIVSGILARLLAKVKKSIRPIPGVNNSPRKICFQCENNDHRKENPIRQWLTFSLSFNARHDQNEPDFPAMSFSPIAHIQAIASPWNRKKLAFRGLLACPRTSFPSHLPHRTKCKSETSPPGQTDGRKLSWDG